MPELLALSNEIIGHIIQVVRPSDLESFAYSNKLIYALAKEALKRHLKFRRYSIVRFDDFESGSDYINVIKQNTRNNSFLLLSSIIQDPEIAEGPRKLRLGNLLDYSDEKNGDNSSDASMIALVDKCDFIPKPKQEWWTNAITLSLDPDAAIGLLITILPNLEFLDTEDWSDPEKTQNFHSIVKSIIDVNQNPNSPSRDKALAHLNRFYMYHPDTEGGEDIEDYFSFAMLPSMRVLIGRNIAGEDRFLWAPTCTNEFSNVREINFKSSAIDASTFDMMLSRIPALMKFTYSYGGATVGIASFNLAGYAEALRNHAAASLERLNITVDELALLSEEEERSEYVGSLQMFSRLISIRLEDVAFETIKFPEDHAVVVPKDEYNTEESDDDSSAFKDRFDRLVEALPPSIRYVTLIQTSANQPVQKIVAGLADEKAETLPKLQWIKFEGKDPVSFQLRGVLAALKETDMPRKSWHFDI